MNDDNTRSFSVLLFVIGDEAAAAGQAQTLRALLTENGHPAEALSVVDLNESPEDTLTYDILAIPTVLRISPRPPVRIIGELSDRQKVWALLSA